MAKFIQGSELNFEIENTFREAKRLIIIISPYLKLHDRIRAVLKSKSKDPNIQLIVVFGKNEDDITKSMTLDDFILFKSFPNVLIKHEKRLHAKYYANESSAILSSMNLYDFSQDHNIEAGIKMQFSRIGNLVGGLFPKAMSDGTLDNEAWTFFSEVINTAIKEYEKIPEFESAVFGILKKYKESKITCDRLQKKFNRKDYENELQGKNIDKFKYNENSAQQGYCIRTGKPIPFNMKMPLSQEAFAIWEKFQNKDYPEKYCHYSGEESKGETSFSRPVLKKNLHKAKEEYAI